MFKDPIRMKIKELEEAILTEQDAEKRANAEEELKRLYELKEQRRKNLITPDTVLKCACMVGLALLGYIAESKGHILPRWGQGRGDILKI